MSEIPKTSPTRLRQIALISDDREKCKHVLTTVLGTDVVFEDPRVATWGLQNFLVSIGGDFIEVCTPSRPSTTVGRLLQKRGEGGYMIIMQSNSARQRRDHIMQYDLCKVILSHEHSRTNPATGEVVDKGVCVQYHPKGIPGGMMPELDSHEPSKDHLDPVGEEHGSWHACGDDYEGYRRKMRMNGGQGLRLVRVKLRLGEGDEDVEAAARRWRELFGIQSQGSELLFTNLRMEFVQGIRGLGEGLESVMIECSGKQRVEEIVDRARKEGIWDEQHGCIRMIGVSWFLTAEGHNLSKSHVLQSKM